MGTAVGIERYADAERFLADARPWLEAAEAENSLILGIALASRARAPSDEPSYWAAVMQGEGIVGCACRTPPRALVLSRLPTNAIDALVADVGAVYSSLNAVNGPNEDAEAFASAWTRARGGRWKTRMSLKLHELTEVTAPRSTPPGSLRSAGDADAALAREWVDAYIEDTGLEPVADDDVVARLIRHGQLFFWVDRDEPRSMAATARETISSCSIHGVYTPPRHRRRGYATATVAALSRMLLDRGRKFCCLYTDASNPTSNSIYAKIGYRPIRDEAEIAFER